MKLILEEMPSNSSDQTIRELLQCLSKVLEEKILQELSSSEYFSLMTDESTDIAF